MSEPTLTDRRLSHASREYEWTTTGHPESHDYLLSPVLRLLERHGARRVLDLGCGNGALSGALASRQFAATGLDYSSSGIALARHNFPAAHFEQHDVTAPLPAAHVGAYDAVVSIEVIEHLLLPRLLVANALRSLRPGGLLIISTPFHGYLKNLALALTNGFDSHWHPLRDFGHVKFFSRATLEQLLSEAGLARLTAQTAGRFYPLSKSMIVSGLKAE
ncbi:MAG TPA: class I SAM-dependent methyltransferase [Steroidobacteraceae bacterium]|nr:class I SAM-dependent methyltransferase [Steroidobacteraceae bacterium]